MAESIFTDKTILPTRAGLETALGDSAAWLHALEQHLTECCGEVTNEWKFYGKQAGWTLAVARQGRRIFHLIPRAGHFTLVFTLGKASVAAAHDSDLPAEQIAALDNARAYAEGRSIRCEVAAAEDLGIARQWIAIKLAH